MSSLTDPVVDFLRVVHRSGERVWYAAPSAGRRYFVSSQPGCPTGASTDEIVFPKSGITASGLVLVPAGTSLAVAIERGMADFHSPRPVPAGPRPKSCGERGYFKAKPFTQR